jgi:hypothetical protein
LVGEIAFGLQFDEGWFCHLVEFADSAIDFLHPRLRSEEDLKEEIFRILGISHPTCCRKTKEDRADFLDDLGVLVEVAENHKELQQDILHHLALGLSQ